MDNTTAMINELTAALETMEPEVLGAAVLTVTGLFALIVAFGVIRYLMTALGYSKMYRKAGEAGWKAFIPVYNTYNNYKISWNGKLFFLYAALYIVMNLLGNSTEIRSLLAGAAGLGVMFLLVKQNVKMAKLFGKGAGTAIALILFPGITSLILGLGKAEFKA